jgi:hypothetical protein
MATVYKIDLELTSHWVSYPPETIKLMLEKQLEELITDEKKHHPSNEINVHDIRVIKKA